jgi:formyltetrahydrofolate-dependent phosphoribosylglycinamide formyltransferase
MLERLQKKWKVNGARVLLILVTFAVGGSLTGYVGRRLMDLTGIENPIIWTVVYIILITLLWPLSVLLVSIPFGQLPFFKSYISKIFRWLDLQKQNPTATGKEVAAGDMAFAYAKNSGPKLKSENFPVLENVLAGIEIRVAIFASGSGSNALEIIHHFHKHSSIKIALIVCNKAGAGVLDIAHRENIPVMMLEKEKFFRGNGYVDELKEKKIDFIVLAGFLWKIPSSLIKEYPKKIINIHPALLPKYGGKGMYGQFVHESVIRAHEKESGISIHFVDEILDHGEVIFQSKCRVDGTDTPQTLARKIHKLEHEFYPKVIESVISARYANSGSGDDSPHAIHS